MSVYVRWTEADGELPKGMVELWTEVAQDGVVTRELGFEGGGIIVHQCPSSAFPDGTYGLFDLAPVDVSGSPDTLEQAEFENQWAVGLRLK